MTQPNDDTSGTRTFTQADLDRAAAAGAQRERQRAAEKYADYDDLKRVAEAAGKSQSQLDKMQEQLTALTTRAERAEHANTRREIADEFGLTAREAGRLRGKTLDELRTDAEEFVADMGIDVKARKAGKAATTAPKGEATDGQDGTDGDGTDTDADDAPSRQPAPTRTARPRETLSSGAPRTPTTPDETNPLKLVENIPRR